ncbi:hypothetical protein EBR96_01515 [bacterium]|nr:hypothetical protein [bacterium]
MTEKKPLLRPYESDSDDTSVFLAPKRSDKHDQFVNILKVVLPYISTDEAKVILTQVMVALKVEGIIGQEMTAKTTKMVNVISESIMNQPARKREALNFAQRLLK